jgi:magnesium transporter
MIRMWKQQNGLTEIQASEKDCWIEITNPTAEEKEKIIQEFRIPEDFLQDILDIDERSRVEVEGRWFLIIMRIPVYLPEENISYTTIPLGVLISPNMIITISLYENDIINTKVFKRLKKFSIDNRHNFVLFLLLRSANYYLNYLKSINRQTTAIENELRKSTRNAELAELLNNEKSLVYFSTSLKSNELLITKLQKTKAAQSDLIDEDLLEDVIIEVRQASEMARIHSDILAGMMNTFASVISNNLNVVMKRLTTITIILMIPTLISSMFGMNIPNFMETNSFAFIGVFLSSILITALSVIFFRWRKWF